VSNLSRRAASGEFTVIGGFISPSHQEYVSSKTDTQAIPSEDRIEMCKLSCEDSECSDWLVCDPWEASYEGFVDFPSVLKRLDRHLVENDFVTALSLVAPSYMPAPPIRLDYRPIKVSKTGLEWRTGYSIA
jgi:hypothetical protein